MNSENSSNSLGNFDMVTSDTISNAPKIIVAKIKINIVLFKSI